MRIAILSDTHGRQAWVRQALDVCATRGAELILHCGDIDDSATVRLFPAHTHFVFGNCDGDRDSIRRAVEDIGATLHEPFGQLELEGRQIGFVHSDDGHLFRDLQASEAFDFLFYGHTHVAKEHRAGKTRVINPGALHRTATRSLLFLDLPAGLLEKVELHEEAL